MPDINYIKEIISATWPVSVIMGITAVVILYWIMPKRIETDSLLDHPTAASNEPIAETPIENFYCEKCKKESIYLSICDAPDCDNQTEEPFFDEKKHKNDQRFCQCTLSKDLAYYHGKDVECPQCKKMTNHKS